MEKKIQIFIPILGWLIIIFHVLFLYQVSTYITLQLNLPILPLAVKTFTYRIIFSPLELLMLSKSLSLPYIANSFFSIIGIVCGLGILKLNNIARIYALAMSWIRIITGLVFALYLMQGAPNLPKGIISYLPNILSYVVFILFLTRPKVKAQFKQVTPPSTPH